MSLCPCDINTHSFSVMLKGLAEQGYSPINGKNVIHIGSHDGIEFLIYNHFCANKVYWFECNPYVFPDLLTRISGDKRHFAYQTALWSESGKELEFNFYRDQKDGASGFFLPEKMFDHIKDCPLLEEKIKIKTNTLNNYINDGIVSVKDVSFLNIDVQGAELEVFKGATTLLESPDLKFIWCEVSWDNVYKDAPLIDDITEYLSKYNFELVGVREDWAIHGDALYVRT